MINCFYSGYDFIEIGAEGNPIVSTSVYIWRGTGLSRFVDFLKGTIWQRGWSQSMCRRWAKANFREKS